MQEDHLLPMCISWNAPFIGAASYKGESERLAEDRLLLLVGGLRASMANSVAAIHSFIS